MLVSIVINNYNYSKFLDECIRSALNQSYKKIEVIVVDDGSSDNSVALIKKYDHTITSIFKKNGGQGSAYNQGFELARGDFILFLDADDFLYSDVISRCVDAITNETAKVQYRLQMINEAGNSLGKDFPNFLHSGNLIETIKKFGFYAGPPGSGNVYRRSILEQYFPMQEDRWRIAADTYPALIGPFFGNVVTLKQCGGAYRIHNNKDRKDQSRFVLNNNPSKPSESVKRTYQSRAEIKKVLLNTKLLENQGDFKYHPPAMAKIRMISLRVSGDNEHPIDGDGVLRCLFDGIVGVFFWPQLSIDKKIKYLVWLLSVALMPKKVAEHLILKAIK